MDNTASPPQHYTMSDHLLQPSILKRDKECIETKKQGKKQEEGYKKSRIEEKENAAPGKLRNSNVLCSSLPIGMPSNWFY